jgi:hypothetical protein
MTSNQGTSQDHGQDTTPLVEKTISRRKQGEPSPPQYISPTVELVDEDAGDDSRDEEDNVFELDLGGEDIHARHNGIVGNGIVLQSGSKTGRATMADLPLELRDQIRRMIQQECEFIFTADTTCTSDC